MKTILVTGATGSLGGTVVRTLVGKGFKARAAVRNPAKARLSAGVDVVRFAYEETASHGPALQRVEGLVLVAPPLDPEAPAKLMPVIDRARATGVEHVVFISAFGVDAVEQAPLRKIERHLMASGTKYTILRPNFFMDNFTTGFLASSVKQGAIYLAAEEGKTSFISTQDIAEVVGAVFQKGLVGKEYNLTGPEALDHATVASILSKVSGKPVAYHALTEEAMFKGMRDSGMPDSTLQYVGALYSAVRAGYASAITNDFETVTGRKPKTFEAFVREHAANLA
jgi:uncharacterized protein YbjT (DUF2867 family)